MTKHLDLHEAERDRQREVHRDADEPLVEVAVRPVHEGAPHREDRRTYHEPGRR